MPQTHQDAGARAARMLMRDRESLAQAVTDALYRESPALLERHGERGRTHCLQDMRYNIDHLIPAVDLGDDVLFSRYIEWLDDMLRARGVSTRDVIRCLELLRAETAARYTGDESRAIAATLDAGLRVLTPA